MIDEKAQELGRLIGQSNEYQAMRRAEQRQKIWQNVQKMVTKTVGFKHFYADVKYFHICAH